MYNIVELFSGIGSQAKALENLGVKMQTVGTSEWDVHAIVAYDFLHNKNHDIPEDIALMKKEELLEVLKKYTFSNSGKAALDHASLATYSEESLKRIYASVIRNKNFVDITGIHGKEFPDNIDILTYSFPCQDLSNVGAFHGYTKGIDKDSGSRSSLLWQVGRILSEMKECNKDLPKYLLMENVPALLSDRHYPNFSVWINDLKNLGYISKYYLLNASDFGIPQNRPRLLMISVYVGDNAGETELVLEYFKAKDRPEDVVVDYANSKYYRKYTVPELLRTNYEDPILFAEAVEATPNETVSRKKIWDDNPQIVLPGYKYNEQVDVVRTITTKQDRNPNSGNLYFDSGIKGRGKFRYLTPRECMLFMGFTDEDYLSLAINNVHFHKGDGFFSRDKIIRMSGNSIPVKLLEGVFLQIIQIDQLLKDYRAHADFFGTDINKKNADLVRSYLFASGIRSRLKKEVYPPKADLLYPKYRTAVYFRDCFWNGHDCDEADLPEVNHEFWNAIIERNKRNDTANEQSAISMGWNAVIVWNCALSDLKLVMTEKAIEEAIKGNLNSSAGEGQIITIL